MYRASRAGEEPGVTFDAATVSGAKAHATRALEAGAFAGQRITLVELDFAADGGWMRTDRVWRKAAHTGGWQSLGEAK